MKLRIKGESLRLRVSRSELDRIVCGERVEETIHFSSDPGAKLTCSLEKAQHGASTGVHYSPGQITVLLAQEEVVKWSDPGRVGIYASVANGSVNSLELAIEKDYACLDGSDEDNADTFENPHAAGSC